MNLLVGIGNVIRLDDGLGPYMAQTFKAEGWQTIDCGTVPENFTSKIKQAEPELVVFVDAAEMGLDAGAFRIIPKEKIKDVSCSTHNLPLSLMIDFLQQSMDVEMPFIGVQPALVSDGEEISPEVFQGLGKLAQALIDDPLMKIPVL
jgi:hydrogenase 3 maturation protease